MPWKRMLAYVIGDIEESLLKRVEYLLEENRVLRNQLAKRPKLSNSERLSLATKAMAMTTVPVMTVVLKSLPMKISASVAPAPPNGLRNPRLNCCKWRYLRPR